VSRAARADPALPVACERRDARARAAHVLAAAEPGAVRFAYGTPDRMRIGLGVQDELVIDGERIGGSPACAGHGDPWKAIDAFLGLHAGEPVFGHLGFDLHGFGCSRQRAAGYPATRLVVPERVIEVDRSGARVRVGDAADLRARLSESRPCSHPADVPCSGAALAASDPHTYLDDVARVLDWIRAGEGRQLTLARRVRSLQPVDLLGTLAAGDAPDPRCRSFYVGAPGYAFAGQSPELLADGDPEGFRTYKISGTYPRAEDPDADAGLRRRFEGDPKNLSEHACSIRGLRASLESLGAVREVGHGVMDLLRLRHLLTVLETRPRPGIGAAACLQAVFPAGATPREEGMGLIERVERLARGAYYGLVGELRPDGRFAFSQILRTVFETPEGCWLWAGAAVSACSTPEDELRETELKLSGIEAVVRESPAGDPAGPGQRAK